MMSGKDSLSKKDRAAIIYMPIIVVLMTAVLGTGIGVWFQNRSFRRNELFKAKLDRIMAGQKEAVEILKDVDEARRQIRSNEDFIRGVIERQGDPEEKAKVIQYYSERDPMEASVAILKEAKIRLDALGDYSRTLSQHSAVPASVENYSDKQQAFLKCLAGNRNFSISCSDEHPDLVDALRAVVVSHTKMTDELINEYE
ncbi:MAG TPA: hypothetical protein VGC89_07250 [Pyrinomonadaceae bacterium]